jgi:hypothetical protein
LRAHTDDSRQQQMPEEAEVQKQIEAYPYSCSQCRKEGGQQIEHEWHLSTQVHFLIEDVSLTYIRGIRLSVNQGP